MATRFFRGLLRPFRNGLAAYSAVLSVSSVACSVHKLVDWAYSSVHHVVDQRRQWRAADGRSALPGGKRAMASSA